MIRHTIYVLLAILFASPLLALQAQALNEIIRPYQSVRAAGMGNVRLTTGLYDENFFGNPGRVTHNPIWRVQLPDPMIESTIETLSAVDDLLTAEDMLTNIAEHAGTNLHARVQTTFPGVYFPYQKWGFAFAVITSTQANVDLRKSYRVEPQVITDVGPAITVGRKFLPDDVLSAGITTHLTYRLSSKEDFTMVNLLQGDSLGPAQSGGDGAHLDFDVGGTYVIPFSIFEIKFSAAGAINNILGGYYTNLGLSLLDNGNAPLRQPRTFGFGGKAERESLWKFTDLLFAFEVTDLGNNRNGPIFKTIHFGGEAKFDLIRVRLGINQGYFAAGLGFDLKVVELDLATYGEEMSLSMGSLQDRRFALRLGFYI